MSDMPNDNPAADQASHDRALANSKHSMEGYLFIRDVLYVNGPVILNGVSIDAIINVGVVQTGMDKLEVEYFEVVDDMVDIVYEDGTIRSINYREEDNDAIFVLMEEFVRITEMEALQIAIDTAEENWNYRLTE